MKTLSEIERKPVKLDGRNPAKLNESQRDPAINEDFKRFCAERSRQLVEQVNQTKEALFEEFRQMYQAPERLLRLALNEAEALAWQTEYPHLVFPELAAEKAQSAAEWERRQRNLNRGRSSLAFAA